MLYFKDKDMSRVTAEKKTIVMNASSCQRSLSLSLSLVMYCSRATAKGKQRATFAEGKGGEGATLFRLLRHPAWHAADDWEPEVIMRWKCTNAGV